MNKQVKRKSLALLLVLGFVLMLFAGCSAAEESSAPASEGTTDESGNSSEASIRKPSIRNRTSKIFITQGEEYDLMSNVTGTDGSGSDITDRIKLDAGGFDSSVPGEYTVTYTLADSEGNEAESSTRTVVVRDGNILAAPEIYNGDIAGEASRPDNPKVYGGAWYRKVVSSSDKWVGIEGTVTLPEVVIRRYNSEYNEALDADPNAKNHDNPSIYMGGHAISESDVGLSFSKALIDVEKQTISKGSIVFRPFWRYITSEGKDEGDYTVHDGEYAVSANGNNCIANYHWRYTEYYYLPGDKLRMIVYSPEPDMLQLQIEVIEKSSLPSSVALRAKYGWKDPANFKSPLFRSPGNGTGRNVEYKRVNAIDQTGNEGKTAFATQSLVSNAVWHDTFLYRVIDEKLCRVPLTDNRRGTVNAPDDSRFSVTESEAEAALGGETVTIHPGYVE